MIDEQLEMFIKEIVTRELSNDSKNDIEDEKSTRYVLAQLGVNADNTQIINKINEIINELNKSLIDNRI